MPGSSREREPDALDDVRLERLTRRALAAAPASDRGDPGQHRVLEVVRRGVSAAARDLDQVRHAGQRVRAHELRLRPARRAPSRPPRARGPRRAAALRDACRARSCRSACRCRSRPGPARPCRSARPAAGVSRMPGARYSRPRSSATAATANRSSRRQDRIAREVHDRIGGAAGGQLAQPGAHAAGAAASPRSRSARPGRRARARTPSPPRRRTAPRAICSVRARRSSASRTTGGWCSPSTSAMTHAASPAQPSRDQPEICSCTSALR